MPENESKVYMTLYDDIIHDKSPRPTPNYAVGDTVRITMKQSVFNKTYIPIWTEEIFKISAIQQTNPITYKIKDMNGEEIQGTFYEQELQKTHQDTFRIEKVIRTKGNKMRVKWKGYRDNFNSWIDKSDVVSLKQVLSAISQCSTILDNNSKCSVLFLRYLHRLRRVYEQAVQSLLLS